VFCIGVIVQTSAKGPPSIYGGEYSSSDVPYYWPDFQVDLSPVWALVRSVWLSRSTMPRLLLPRYEEASSLFNHLLSHSASWYLSGLITASHLGYEAQGTNMTMHWKGANFIGGSGAGQHEAAWRLPLALQLVPAVILGVGILFMPFSPRWVLRILGLELCFMIVLSIDG